MHFSGREVESFAETVPEEQLVVGRTYFSVHFADAEMLEPELEALVYIGRDLFAESPEYYFQDAASFRAGLTYQNGVTDEVDVHCAASGQVHVMEFDRALDRLLYCSL